MRTSRLSRSVVVAALVLLGVATPVSAQAAGSTPEARTLYQTGPSGRYLLDGHWLFQRDPPGGDGIALRFQSSTSESGWARVAVPNAWNATDETLDSFLGGVGWYRKDFKLPSSARGLSWVVRFESVNYRSKVWLNGKPVGSNRGAYLPFEIRLPGGLLKRSGVNRLVVRVDSRRKQTDFPPSGLSFLGKPTGGWWNYGGLLREVYLRRIDDIDFNTVLVRPTLPCRTCKATVLYRATLRNYGDHPRRVTVSARLGGRRVALGAATIGPKGFVTFSRSVELARPRLWSPATPYLYDASLTASSGGRVLQHYTLKTGVRSIKVVDGQLFLNGQPMNFRGVALHEDSRQLGFAIDNRVRDQQLAWTKELGATVLRAHYPLHPYTQERADALGLMQWSEIPVYSIKTQFLAQALVRQLAARELESNIRTNGNHPSVIVWSLGNELSSRPGPVQGMYIQDAANRARALDPTRPVGLAIAGYPAVGCQPRYAPIQVIGINDYFGWYPGPNGQIADRTLLSEYLDAVRACYPRQAIVMTEFGAEANRDGPVEEKGTYAFQQDFVNYHLGVYATKPWLSGAIYWALQEFRVRPEWEGGNPRPSPPLHQKGVVTFDGGLKPAFADLQRSYRGTRQFRSRSGAG